MKGEDRTYVGIVQRVCKKDEVAGASRLVSLVLRNGKRALVILLLGNDGKGGRGVWVLDARCRYVSAHRVWEWQVRTHRTVKLLTGLLLQSQVNTFEDWATVIEDEIERLNYRLAEMIIGCYVPHQFDSEGSVILKLPVD